MVYAASSDSVFQFLIPWGTGAPDASMKITRVGQILGLALNIVFGSAVAISMIAMIFSGIKYVMAKGDPKAAAAAQQSLTHSVIALILTIGAYTIKTIIFNVLGGDFKDLVDATPGI